VKRRGHLPAGIDELDAVLLDEAALLHLRQHVEPLQHPVRFGNQRLADMKPWKLFTLEQLHAQPLLRHQRRHRRSSGPTAHHDDIRTHAFHSSLSYDDSPRGRSVRTARGVSMRCSCARNATHTRGSTSTMSPILTPLEMTSV